MSDNGNTSIIFNPSANGETIANQDETKGRAPHIGLAHELLHADVNKDGDRDKTKVNIKNPDGNSPGSFFEDEKNEVDIRERENTIRQEQGEPLRVIPFWTPLNNKKQ